MAETEVEIILREIRERMLSEQRPGQEVTGTAVRSAITNAGNGAADYAVGEMPNSATFGAENLALINSYLTTTARAWDRLPPVVSNRSGLAARLELWLKRHLKRATRWYAWEQVNFNAAVHHALRDLLAALSAYEQGLLKLRAQIDAEAEVRTRGLDQLQAELTAQRAEINVGLDAQNARLAEVNPRLEELSARLAELAGELRERDEHLRDEQRVCFKQLALELSEAAVLEDRARRKTEALLEKLQRRVEELDKR
jgi:hypothetical protein